MAACNFSGANLSNTGRSCQVLVQHYICSWLSPTRITNQRIYAALHREFTWQRQRNITPSKIKHYRLTWNTFFFHFTSIKENAYKFRQNTPTNDITFEYIHTYVCRQSNGTDWIQCLTEIKLANQTLWKYEVYILRICVCNILK